MWALPLGCSPPPPAGAEPSKNVWRPRAPTWALLGAQPHSPLVRPRESLLKSKRFPTGGERVVVGPQLGMAADMPFGRPGLGAPQTRLLTRHLEEVWFLGHACHALVASLFTSLFAGKREVPPLGGGGRPQHTSEQPQHTSERHPRCSLRFIWGGSGT